MFIIFRTKTLYYSQFFLIPTHKKLLCCCEWAVIYVMGKNLWHWFSVVYGALWSCSLTLWQLDCKQNPLIWDQHRYNKPSIKCFRIVKNGGRGNKHESSRKTAEWHKCSYCILRLENWQWKYQHLSSVRDKIGNERINLTTLLEMD